MVNNVNVRIRDVHKLSEDEEGVRGSHRTTASLSQYDSNIKMHQRNRLYVCYENHWQSQYEFLISICTHG
ncbi:hypothetical protein EYC80_005378 [Monilinia laxa]|uniref:Uncharacterized protein n=1 Tax=Monilinia laxa TaxID=61186 RepID=A0A5N6KK07_MONLA|nr:hypothetical protein EYC80_005378 [Monilinia laxa]